MTTIPRNTFLSWLPLFGLVGIVIFYLLHAAPEIDLNGDAFSYASFSPTRPPLYPIFLWLFHGFGQHQFVFAMWCQTMLALAALFYAKYWLQTRLKLPSIITFVILLFTTLVILMHYRVITLIYSEGLALPIFIVASLLLIDCFAEFDLKKLILLTVWCNLLILTRAQFYYFYPLLISLLFWHAWKKTAIKKIMLGFLIIFIAVALTAFINRTYHYLMHGHFSDAPAVGTQFIVQGLYLANQEEVQHFKSPDEQALFLKIIKELEHKQLTKNSAPAVLETQLGFATAYPYYNTAYLAIQNLVAANLAGMTPYQIEALTLKMSKVLYLHALKENLLFYFWKVSNFFGGISLFIAFLIVFFAMIFLVSRQRAYVPSFEQVFILAVLLIVFANTAFVAIFEQDMPRYNYYSYFLLYCLSGWCVKKYLKLNQPQLQIATI